MRPNDAAHREETARRWIARLTDPDWSPDQCGRCLAWVPLAGRWGLDWGACTNADSRNDGRVTFEQDRCPAFVDGGERWTRPVRETPPVG